MAFLMLLGNYIAINEVFMGLPTNFQFLHLLQKTRKFPVAFQACFYLSGLEVCYPEKAQAFAQFSVSESEYFFDFNPGVSSPGKSWSRKFLFRHFFLFFDTANRITFFLVFETGIDPASVMA